MLSQSSSLPLFPWSLFPPILIRFCRRRRCLPGPCQVYYRLLPPLHTHLRPWCSLHPLTQVQNIYRRYELCNHVLLSPNVFFHLLESRLLSLAAAKVYSHFPSIRRRGSLPVNRLAT